MLISITYTKKEIEIFFLVFKYFLSIISPRKYKKIEQKRVEFRMLNE